MLNYVLQYLKGSAAAIIAAVISLSFLLEVIYHNFDSVQFYFISVFGSVIGYLFGLIAFACFLLANRKGYTQLTKYLIFLVLGLISGGIVEFFTGLMLFPASFVSTIIGSFAFIISQKIKSKLAILIISVIPLIVIFIYPLFW
ncbi:hypothetical protein RG959_23585 [Domibacillus sp. 8LH]|uniref:hypothetical protein n=1 Tax=Domibacillus sp. 8LH TaxID=3073900 RepID=UPI0031705049